MINVKELSLFENFMEVFFDKQNKKVRKSFLHSHGFKYLKAHYDERKKGMIILSCSRDISVISF